MPRVGFEPTTPVFERAKTVHSLYSAATVIGFSSVIAEVYRRCAQAQTIRLFLRFTVATQGDAAFPSQQELA
jgi:hypothetical protein